jgi:hypothetical protein
MKLLSKFTVRASRALPLLFCIFSTTMQVQSVPEGCKQRIYPSLRQI